MSRRQEMNDAMNELKDAVQTTETNQGDILDLAVIRLREYQARVKSLEEQLQSRAGGKRLIMDNDQGHKFTLHEGVNKGPHPLLRGERAAKRALVVAPSPGLGMSFTTVFNESSIGMLMGDFNGRILDANRMFQQMLGWSLDDLRGRRMLQFTHPDDTQHSCASINAQVHSNASPTVLSKRIFCRSGAYLDVSVVCWIVRDVDHKPLYWASIMYPRDSIEPSVALATVAAISASGAVPSVPPPPAIPSDERLQCQALSPVSFGPVSSDF